MITLDKGKAKTNYKICGYVEEDRVVKRFLELGLTKGETVILRSTSILKKVCLIEVRGYLLSIKTPLLSKIYVEKA